MTTEGKTPKDVKRPRRLDMKDLPRDPQRALGSLRSVLCKSFNYCRKYPKKLELFREVLEYALQRVEQYQKEEAEYAAEKARKADAEKKNQSTEEDKATGDETAGTDKGAKTVEKQSLVGIISAIQDKEELEVFGLKYGIDLNKAKTLDNMKADLLEHLAELAKKKAAEAGGGE